MRARILVPLDGSPTAEAVVPQVVELAEARQAEIVLLRVVLVHALPGANQVDAQVRAVTEAETYLAALERGLTARGLTVSTAVRYGHAAAEILDHAAAGGCTLIAMSTHGRSGIRRWVMGSVAEAVSRRSPVPVLLLRSPGGAVRAETAPEPPQAPVVMPGRVRHVLCPVDLSPATRTVLETAEAIAERFGAELTVLHVIDDPLDVTCSHIPHPPMEELRAEMIRLAEASLGRQIRRVIGARPQPGHVVVAGRPYRQIVGFAQTHGVDLIVMGTKGLTGLEHIVMGSTAERVIRTATCPVFSIRAAA